MQPSRESPDDAFVFPPALVPILRRELGTRDSCCRDVDDAVLAHLLTAVFFAGLETEEGEHHPVRVVFVGESVAPPPAPAEAPEGGPIYRWSTTRFRPPRAFGVSELVKLSVVTSASDRVYTRVRYAGDRLQVTGLAREGFNYEDDPFLKVLAPRPGTLSVRLGHDRVLDYERGSLLTGGEDVAIFAGPVRRALARFAREAELDEDAVGDYLAMVRAVVREMAAHGRGGILVVARLSPEIRRELPGYRTEPEGSPITLLRELRRGPRRRGPPAGERRSVSLGEVLRGTFLSEAERVVQELGATTATDGAALLDPRLALVGFGLILPVSHRVPVREACDLEGRAARPFDLSTRGTRHVAAATFAHLHPGCVVFVASQDGEVACLHRAPGWPGPLLWRLGPKM
jgi:hypothetical protein